jgi:dTMP kinase
VLCDRFIDSTRVYQGLAGVSTDLINALERVTIEDLRPDLTLILDLPADIGLARADARRGTGTDADRFERDGLEVHRQRREAFLAIAQSEPQRCAVIDASASREAVADAIWGAVSARLFTATDADAV